LHRALAAVFGELDAAEIQSEQPNSPQGTFSRLSAKWEMLKAKLGGREAEFIDLLQHGEMSVAQLRAAAHCDIRTAYKVIEKMKAAGLLDRHGGKFSLRDL
jgi:DNA-binding MarR family transcriptional regulator